MKIQNQPYMKMLDLFHSSTKVKKSLKKETIPTENFTPISKEELDDGINPILESQRITIGQSSSKFPLFLITFILGVLILHLWLL